MLHRHRAYAIVIGLYASAALAVGCDDSRGTVDASTPGADAQVDPHDAALTPDAGVDGGGGGADAGPLETLPLHTLDVGAITSGSPATFTIPADAIGFSLVVRGAGESFAAIESITAPSGAVVVADRTPLGGSFPLYVGEGAVSAAVPQGDGPLPPLEAGEWSFIATGTDLQATVYVQTATNGEFAGGLLDLDLYVPDGLMIADPLPSHAVSAADAATDPSVLARADAFYHALAEVFGLGRGEVRVHVLPADRVTVSSYEELFALTVSDDDDPRSFHLMLQQGVTVAGVEVWGIAPSIPGVPIETGHAWSAVALNVAAGFSAVADGYTAVHELGHFLGLFHSSELDGLSSDLLSDTPACGLSASIDPWSCPDGHNIMFALFWGASGGQDIIASPAQLRVVQGSPMYRPTVLPFAPTAQPMRMSSSPDGARRRRFVEHCPSHRRL